MRARNHRSSRYRRREHATRDTHWQQFCLFQDTYTPNKNNHHKPLRYTQNPEPL